MAEPVSVTLKLELRHDGTAPLVLSTVHGAKDPTPKPVSLGETAEVRHYAYRLLSLNTLPRRLLFVSAFRSVGGTVYAVADAVKVIDGEKEQPIIPARYSDLEETVFRASLGALFPEHAASLGGILLQEISLREFKDLPDNAGHSFEFVKKVEFRKAPLLEYSCCLPIPGEINKRNGSLPEHATVIGSLCATRGVYVVATEVWAGLKDASDFLDSSARRDKGFIVRLKGEPGSGKEVFANILHHGGLRSHGAKYSQRSLGGLRTADVQQQLVGRITSDGVHVGSDIADAANGTLFLDEVEKIKNDKGDPSPKDLGNFLLRILEAKRYDPSGSKGAVRVENLNWIFAGAKLEASDADGHLPRDFISRQNGEIRIVSPLDSTDANHASDYATELFIYFTFCHVANALGYHEISQSASAKTYRRNLASWILAASNWEPAGHIREVAKEVGTAASTIRPTHSISARSISRLAERFAQVVVRIGEEKGFRPDNLLTKNDPAYLSFNDHLCDVLKGLCPPNPLDVQTVRP